MDQVHGAWTMRRAWVHGRSSSSADIHAVARGTPGATRFWSSPAMAGEDEDEEAKSMGHSPGMSGGIERAR
jgi:hypothetical protein